MIDRNPGVYPRNGYSASSAGGSSSVDYRVLTAKEMGLSDAEARLCLTGPVPRERPGLRIPEITSLEEIRTGAWQQKLVTLPDANTLDNWYYQQRLFGVVEDESGVRRIFIPQTLLLKLRDRPVVAALRVAEEQEMEAIRLLETNEVVQCVRLNCLQQRTAMPNDPDLPLQWHHAVIGSSNAWDITTGNDSIRVAVLDAPFQMDHADLAPNVRPGWNVVAGAPVTESPGIEHSTGAAGLVAAVVNNGVGIAGAVNCQILPIQINGTLAEMYLGTLWAASNNVRAVNISWTGAEDPIMNWAGMALKDGSRGVLVMAGGNPQTRVDYTNQPLVIAISATDTGDRLASTSGPHVDFAAPGVSVFTTTTASGYASRTGTSFAAPIFSGVVATLLTINPALGPEEVVEILKSTAVDLGAPGQDEEYGWGRIDFGRSALAAQLTIQSNTPPVMVPIGAHWLLEGEELTFTIQASDAELPGQSLTFSLGAGSPSGTTINAATGVFSFVATPEQAGQTFALEVQVTDDGTPPLQTRSSFPVYVLPDGYALNSSIAARDGNQEFRIEWPALDGIKYSVQRKSNLSEPDWETVAEITAHSALGTFIYSNQMNSAEGYFRVLLVR